MFVANANTQPWFFWQWSQPSFSFLYLSCRITKFWLAFGNQIHRFDIIRPTIADSTFFQLNDLTHLASEPNGFEKLAQRCVERDAAALFLGEFISCCRILIIGGGLWAGSRRNSAGRCNASAFLARNSRQPCRSANHGHPWRYQTSNICLQSTVRR